MLSKKLKNITPSFTIGISTKVNELKRSGKDIINLSIGEPDFLTPDCAKEAAIKAINDNKTKYDNAQGLNELREAICKKLLDENGVSYEPSQIVVSSGAKHAITNVLVAITDPGDEILIPKPYWVSYPEMVKLTGGVPVFIDTHENNNYKVTVDDIKEVYSDKTKAIFITNPSNPSGAVYTKEELEKVASYCTSKGIVIIADEIYERITYLPEFTSVATISNEVKENTVIINGLAKSAAMTGWRIGYTASSKEVAKAIASIQGHLVSHPSTISQWASVAAIEKGQADMEHMVAEYRKRRDIIVDMLADIPGIKIVQPDGAFYIFMNMSFLKGKFTDDQLSNAGGFSLALTDLLLEKYSVAVVPGIAFGMDDFIRISYATDINDVTEAISRIARLAAE
jgi:aspartate aminotransferase